MENKKGFTLVELVVSMAIYSILLLTVSLICFFIIDQFEDATNQTTILDETINFRSQLSNVINQSLDITIDTNNQLIIDSQILMIDNNSLFLSGNQLMPLIHIVSYQGAIDNNLLTVVIQFSNQQTKTLLFLNINE